MMSALAAARVGSDDLAAQIDAFVADVDPGPATNLATSFSGFRQNEQDAVTRSSVTAMNFSLRCQPDVVRTYLTPSGSS